MTRITENPYALIGDENDPLGRLDVVTLVGEEMFANGMGFFARYDRGATFQLEPRLVISRDATPDRLLTIRALLMDAWEGAGAALNNGKEKLGGELAAINTDGRYNVEGMVGVFSERWTEQRQAMWRHVIGLMRKQPVLAPEVEA